MNENLLCTVHIRVITTCNHARINTSINSYAGSTSVCVMFILNYFIKQSSVYPLIHCDLSFLTIVQNEIAKKFLTSSLERSGMSTSIKRTLNPHGLSDLHCRRYAKSYIQQRGKDGEVRVNWSPICIVRFSICTDPWGRIPVSKQYIKS